MQAINESNFSEYIGWKMKFQRNEIKYETFQNTNRMLINNSRPLPDVILARDSIIWTNDGIGDLKFWKIQAEFEIISQKFNLQCTAM